MALFAVVPFHKCQVLFLHLNQLSLRMPGFPQDDQEGTAPDFDLALALLTLRRVSRAKKVHMT